MPTYSKAPRITPIRKAFPLSTIPMVEDCRSTVRVGNLRPLSPPPTTPQAIASGRGPMGRLATPTTTHIATTQIPILPMALMGFLCSTGHHAKAAACIRVELIGADPRPKR